MSKSILVPLSQLQFPHACVVCLSPASKEYPIQQIVTYGRRSETITVQVPMCDLHHAAASFKGIAERATGCLGVVLGIIAGILGTILLFLRWEGGGLVPKIIGGAVFGFGMFILVWWVVAILIAPLLAVGESKEARNAVKITRYDPFDKIIQLQFQNEPMAELVQKASGQS